MLMATRLFRQGSGRTALPSRLDELLPPYTEMLCRLEQAVAQWVQLDEPALELDLDDTIRAADRANCELAAATTRPSIMVAGYFSDTTEMLQILSDIDIDAVAVDLVAGSVPAGDVQLGDKLLVAEIVDGRNIWRTDPDVARETLNRLPARGPVAVSSSCSLLHVPYTLAAEQHLDPQLRSWLAFADKKVAEDVALSKALGATDIDADRAIVAARAAAEDRRSSTRIQQQQVRTRISELDDSSVGRVRRQASASSGWTSRR